MPEAKTEQLQIRVSPGEKRAIQRQARRAGMSVSKWLLSRTLPGPQLRLQQLVDELASAEEPGFVFSELLDWLGGLSEAELEAALAESPRLGLDDYWANTLAATLEHAAAQRGLNAPTWTRAIPPLEEPRFGSPLRSLRLYLLLHSPPAFAARNLFVDSTVGDRV